MLNGGMGRCVIEQDLKKLMENFDQIVTTFPSEMTREEIVQYTAARIRLKRTVGFEILLLKWPVAMNKEKGYKIVNLVWSNKT